jgi:ABC-type polysaccharide/polyol phosphate export permease
MRERARNLRDLTVIKRIILCVLMLVLLRFPAIIFIVFGVFRGSLFFLTYPIVLLVTAICLMFIGLITIKITHKFRKQFFKILNRNNNQIHPTTNRPTPGNNTLATIQI